MLRGLLLCANGTEDAELLVFNDVLLRSGQISTTIASAYPKRGNITLGRGVVLSDIPSSQDIDPKDYDFIYVPGGLKGVEDISKSEAALKLIAYFHDSGKDVIAICAAPSILVRLGYLKGKKFTCFPGFQASESTYTGKEIEKDGRLYTGRSMHYTYDLAISYVADKLGIETVRHIEKGTKGLSE